MLTIKFKENMEAVLPGLVKNLLNIHTVSSEEIPDSLQFTKEREPDLLKKITDTEGIPSSSILKYRPAMKLPICPSGWRNTSLC
jgi:hypothetical protein